MCQFLQTPQKGNEDCQFSHIKKIKLPVLTNLGFKFVWALCFPLIFVCFGNAALCILELTLYISCNIYNCYVWREGVHNHFNPFCYWDFIYKTFQSKFWLCLVLISHSRNFISPIHKTGEKLEKILVSRIQFASFITWNFQNLMRL